MTVRAIAFTALLLTEPDLEREYRAMRNDSDLAMLTVIARYPDGSPVRGTIQCSGNWYKHDDGAEPEFAGPSLPFHTDSRGAIIMNPHLEDTWIVCWSESNGYAGKVTAEFSVDRPTGVYEMVMERAR